ncbi:hypothetical protein V1291_003978 [Nitrobacteraceae bacterium AZCC 1564]
MSVFKIKRGYDTPSDQMEYASKSTDCGRNRFLVQGDRSDK